MCLEGKVLCLGTALNKTLLLYHFVLVHDYFLCRNVLLIVWTGTWKHGTSPLELTTADCRETDRAYDSVMHNNQHLVTCYMYMYTLISWLEGP